MNMLLQGPEDWVRTQPVASSGVVEADAHAEAVLESGEPPYEGDATLAAR